MTYGGEPVAEIRPIAEPVDSTVTFESGWEEMVRKGIIVPSGIPRHTTAYHGIPRRPRRTGGHIPGALERFLADRGWFLPYRGLSWTVSPTWTPAVPNIHRDLQRCRIRPIKISCAGPEEVLE